jgi:hypothetical protein
MSYLAFAYFTFADDGSVAEGCTYVNSVGRIGGNIFRVPLIPHLEETPQLEV